MAYDSPLFQSALELFAHSIEHFNNGNEKDRKFVILHLANSIELIFKDLLLDLGESIYKNPKETITITHAIETLTKNMNVTIPFLNKLELLIDERNSLQHRYGVPNEITTIFYMDATFDFYQEFLKANYVLDIDNILIDFLTKKEVETFMLRKVTTKSELDKLIAFAKLHPVGALLSALAYLEARLFQIRQIINDSLTLNERQDNRIILFSINQIDYLPKLFTIYEIDLEQELGQKLHGLRRLRNSVSHGRDTVELEQTIDSINLIKNIEDMVEDLIAKVKKDPERILKDETQTFKFSNKSNTSIILDNPLVVLATAKDKAN